MALPKLRAWYFSGKTMPLKDKAEEESFNRAIEVFHQKWSQDNKGMSFDEWLGKLLPEKITVRRPEKKAEAGSEVTTEETKPKKYYILKSGEYISETAFREAILKYFKEIEKDFTLKVVKKDKGVINVEELVDRIVESIPKNGKVNVAKKPTSPETPTLGETFPTRMQLPNGRFINLQDVAQALQNYMVVEKEKPKPVPPPPPPIEPLLPEPANS